MDFNRGANGRVAQLVRLLEQWMHECLLQKVTKEMKLFCRLVGGAVQVLNRFVPFVCFCVVSQNSYRK